MPKVTQVEQGAKAEQPCAKVEDKIAELKEFQYRLQEKCKEWELKRQAIAREIEPLLSEQAVAVGEFRAILSRAELSDNKANKVLAGCIAILTELKDNPALALEKWGFDKCRDGGPCPPVGEKRKP